MAAGKGPHSIKDKMLTWSKADKGKKTLSIRTNVLLLFHFNCCILQTPEGVCHSVIFWDVPSEFFTQSMEVDCFHQKFMLG